MKNCIFTCVFNNKKYIDMFYLFLESIYISGNLKNNTDILLYTSTEFMNIIKSSHLFCDKIKFELNDSYNNIDKACKARVDLFELKSVTNYDKILYLDTDIIVKHDINELFDICKDEILYVLEEGDLAKDEIKPNLFLDFHGRPLFTHEEVNNMEDTTAFSSGIMLFKNCLPIKTLFKNIKKHLSSSHYTFSTFDQPFIVYNAIKEKLYNNKILKRVCTHDQTNHGDIESDKIIHHFCGGPGIPYHKIDFMTVFLNKIKNTNTNKHILDAKKYITENLLPIIINSNENLEGNIFMRHNTIGFSDYYIDKAKNISNILLNKNIKKVLEIGFNSGFSALLMLLTNPNIHITCCDLGEHLYTIPCFEKINKDFGGRIKLILGNSNQTLPKISDTFDIIHIDGGHQVHVAEKDIQNSYKLSKTGTILIFDDYDFNNLHSLWNYYIKAFELKYCNIQTNNTPFHDIKFISRYINFTN